MAGSSWPGYALPGDAVYCPALAVANNGLSPLLRQVSSTRDPSRFTAGAIQHWRWAVTSA